MKDAILYRLGRMHSNRAWGVVLGILALFCVLLPVLNLTVAPESALHVPTYVITVLGKFVCYAIVAMAVDLIWGFTGILSLGHGVFFALGGYAMGMYLMRSIGTEGVYRSELPDFMVFLDWKELPWFWYGFSNFFFAMAMAVVVPGVLAFIFGYFAFRSRIGGVYFSIITQALTFAMMLWFFRNDTGFGGNNGLTDFKRIYGYTLSKDSTKVALFAIAGLTALTCYLICRYVVTSKVGMVLRAVRDHEAKVLFTGYNSLHYKLFAWTLSAVMCGLAGALYVPQVGIINPSEMQPANSIEMAIWVSIGGRATLFGAALGAFIVNGAKSWFTVEFPEYWLYFLGVLFVVVTLFFPKGLMALPRGLIEQPRAWLRALQARRKEAT